MRYRFLCALSLLIGPSIVFAAEACDAVLTLPEGFCARVFHPGVGARARHLAFAPDGALYVSFRELIDGHGLARLVDANGDGMAFDVKRFGDAPGTGLAIRDGYLYFGTESAIRRYELPADGTLPDGPPEVVADGFPDQEEHADKSLTIDGDGHLYVNVGGPSNACQESKRWPGSPGLDPCPQRERQAGVWRFDADTPGQTQSEDGERFVTGIRNLIALEWHPSADRVYAAQHGRDQLMHLWPELYDEEESAELPSEEFLLLERGDDFGWPYCYHDRFRDRKVLAPEYGGDGEKVGRCADVKGPVVAFPGHWAPNDLVFYMADAFPERFQHGAFIAFRGSWNRAPLPQAGYRVTFVPMDATGRVSGSYETFADGFKGEEDLLDVGQARFRPMGLAVGPAGALFIVDSQQGRIWRVTYEPDGG